MAAACSQAAALSRLQHNRVVQHALQIEPRLQALIDRALQPHRLGYQRDYLYDDLSLQSHHLVGPQAAHPQLRAPLYHQALLLALDDLLPPAEWDSESVPAAGSDL
jgi:hypothetical protein